MIEGEEVGSVNLKPSLKTILKKNLKMILISDTGMISNQQPSITTGLRGLSYVEVEVTGPNRDLHSGLYGGAVANQSIFWQNDSLHFMTKTIILPFLVL
jgi:acetylornithine deacetylase/succinyl-diaminopimelate desuccinylase-like protein